LPLNIVLRVITKVRENNRKEKEKNKKSRKIFLAILENKKR
jgi:hypothetical protein